MKCHQQVLMPADHAPDQHKSETPDPTKAILCNLLRRRVSRSLLFLTSSMYTFLYATLHQKPDIWNPEYCLLLRQLERFRFSSSLAPSLFCLFFNVIKNPSPGKATLSSPFLILYKPLPSLSIMGPMRVAASGAGQPAIQSTLR